jgi:signal transduction histidine kinase
MTPNRVAQHEIALEPMLQDEHGIPKGARLVEWLTERRHYVAGAAAFSGLLAGAGVDRVLQMFAALSVAGLTLLMLALARQVATQRAKIMRLAQWLEQQQKEGTASGLATEGCGALKRLACAIDATSRNNALHNAELLEVLAAYVHDMRTPLTRLILRSGQLDDAETGESFERDCAEINQLLEASLACARMQCCATETPVLTDIDGLLDTIIACYRDAGRSIEREGRVGRISRTCPHALRRVLVNLIDNAFRYGADVRLCVSADTRSVVFAVQDSGPGIAPEELEAVFAPWYRSAKTATRAPGSGLGLSIARRLTVAMHGELQLQNRSAGGLEARVALPLTA